MEVKIIKREKNPLLRREEILFEIEDVKATPSRQEVFNKLVALLNANAELLVIKNIKSKFGTNIVEGKAHLYSSKEVLEKLEPEH
ncbi:MAG: 30S ribosomal protein S24e, partial [Candidatus Iainarchaeum archaeon]